MGSIFLTKWWNKLDAETKDVIYLNAMIAIAVFGGYFLGMLIKTF